MTLNFLKTLRQNFLVVGQTLTTCFCILTSCALNQTLYADMASLTNPRPHFDKILMGKDQEQQQPKYFLVLNSLWGIGFFGDFLTALGALQLYEIKTVSGVSIEYGTGGTYYDPAKGPNWWEYYFEPVHVGDRENATILVSQQGVRIGDGDYDLARLTEFNIYRKDAHALIKKYVHLKPHIKKKVKEIVKNTFGRGKVIGVHYRGTDKFVEDPLAPYEEVAQHVDNALAEFAKKGSPRVKIFVATDEQKFLDYMTARYPSKVIFYQESIRSVDGRPVHTTPVFDNYKRGEDALIDCLLLSKTDYLIKTSSNLSLCSAYFNPSIPMVHASTRNWRAPLE